MMTVIEALREFLQRDQSMHDREREKARQKIRNIVGWRVFRGRVPRGTDGVLQVTLELSTEITYSTTAHPAPVTAPFVDLNVWAKDTDEESGSERAEKLLVALHTYLLQYRGPLSDAVFAQVIKLEGGPNSLPIRPIDAEGWKYRYLTTWMVGHEIVVPTGVD